MAAWQRGAAVAVIGAGAAGSMAAIFAASGDAETLLLERTPDGGRKILISGGGRCNVLPSRADESRFVTDSSPRTLQRMLRSWPLREQIPFFESELGIPLAEETETGKLFPASNRARDVRDALLALARRRGVELLTDTLVTGLAPTSRTAGGSNATERRRSRRTPSSSRPEASRFRSPEATASASRSSRGSGTRFIRRIPR